MQRVADPLAFRELCAQLRRQGASLAFVPTMGALHAGHLALIERAKGLADQVVVSIFVNPTQFGPNEDLASYPRRLAEDGALCQGAGVGVLFTPSVGAIYAENERTRVNVSELTRGLCGARRPGHFDGVCTIVTKLFSLVGECSAVFGEKDYQQLKVIERMARDLFLPVRIVSHPTVREPDGLALSSRNLRLDPEERARALGISRGLASAARLFAAGERNAAVLEAACRHELSHSGLREDYVSCVDADELSPFVDGVIRSRALLAVAAFAGDVRLIDNQTLGVAEHSTASARAPESR